MIRRLDPDPLTVWPDDARRSARNDRLLGFVLVALSAAAVGLLLGFALGMALR